MPSLDKHPVALYDSVRYLCRLWMTRLAGRPGCGTAPGTCWRWGFRGGGANTALPPPIVQLLDLNSGLCARLARSSPHLRPLPSPVLCVLLQAVSRRFIDKHNVRHTGLLTCSCCALDMWPNEYDLQDSTEWALACRGVSLTCTGVLILTVYLLIIELLKLLHYLRAEAAAAQTVNRCSDRSYLASTAPPDKIVGYLSVCRLTYRTNRYTQFMYSIIWVTDVKVAGFFFFLHRIYIWFWTWMVIVYVLC